MKQILPWNVTGIPPEARELARAAAARDGLSVGDWLTRRIYLECPQELQVPRTAPDSEKNQSKRGEETSGEHSEVMLQLARMEGATESALRRIDETLRTLARGGEAARSSQGQAKNSERTAEFETDAAVDEQAQRISHLAQRVESVERTADSATLRKAIRGLHQGVSRLAEQMAKHEIRTANRIDALEGNIDTIPRSAQQTRSKYVHLAKDLEDRLSALTKQIARSEEMLGGMEDQIQEAVEGRVSATERKMEGVSERLHGTERVWGKQARATEEALKSFEERLDLVERRNRETGSELRLSLEEMRDRLDAAERPLDVDHENDTSAINDDTPISLPGMGQELAPRDENQTVTNAAQKFLSKTRRPTSPDTETQPASEGLSLASARPVRKEDEQEKAGAVLRRALPVLSVGFLLAAGVGYLIVDGGSMPFGANIGSARIETPPAAAFAAETDATALPSAVDLFLPLDSSGGPEERIPTSGLVAKSSATADRFPSIANGSSSAAENEEVRRLRHAAELGEPEAQYRLASLYEHGLGVPADSAQAVLWYEQAASRGHRIAMHNLAVAYSNGFGIEKNLTEASRWFRSAADLGFVDSQFNLAVLYERGMGVPMSLEEAYKWYFIAAGQGDSEARTRAELLSTQLPEEQRLAIERAATIYGPPLNRAANENPALAQLQ